jgi:hypothetical protein
MKFKILYVCLGLLAISTILLLVYILSPKPYVCESIHLNDVLVAWGENDIIPDEETARRIADIIIEAQFDNIDDDSVWCRDYVVVTFDEQKYEWTVHYRFPPDTMGEGIKIYLRKDNGMVRDLWFGW